MLGTTVFYVALSIVSFFYVAPHQPGLKWILSAFLVDSDLEADLAFTFVYPVLWVLIPLSSVALCVFSWVAFAGDFKRARVRILFDGIGLFLYVLSIAPAILVFRELLIYSPIHLIDVLSSPAGVLGSLAGFTRWLVYPREVVRWGVLAVPIIVFVETGLFIGFVLPGDSLLFTTGLVAASGLIDLYLLIPLTILGAVAGDQVGYLFGRRSGGALARRYHVVGAELQRARHFYSKHGGKTIVIARFIPVVRTFAPLVAGAAEMRYRRFISFNIVGGVLWVFVLILSGYFLGRTFPKVANGLVLLGIIIVLVGVPISLAVWLRKTRHRTKLPKYH